MGTTLPSGAMIVTQLASRAAHDISPALFPLLFGSVLVSWISFATSSNASEMFRSWGGWRGFNVEGVWADPDVAAANLIFPADLDACWWNSCL